MDNLADSMGASRVKRSDTPLLMFVTYCHENCCTVQQITDVCSWSSFKTDNVEVQLLTKGWYNNNNNNSTGKMTIKTDKWQ